jgi:hypothetical protein
MDRLKLDIRKGTTDRIVRKGREFISFKCIGRTWTETGRLQSLTINTLGWPIPVYQESAGMERYIERKHVERIFDFDMIIVNEENISRPPLVPDGTADSRYMTSMRLKLIADNLWTTEEKAIRGSQRKNGKRIINPFLRLPIDEEEPTLANDAGQFPIQYVNIKCDAKMINTLLRHHKELRPHGAESTTKQRRRLINRQPDGRCDTCGRALKDNGMETHVDHKRGIDEFVNAVMMGKMTLEQAFEFWWNDGNLRAVHKKCNQTTGQLARLHK